MQRWQVRLEGSEACERVVEGAWRDVRLRVIKTLAKETATMVSKGEVRLKGC